MDKIVLVGLIYETNLGDQAIFKCTNQIVKEWGERNGGIRIDSIDLYGRTVARQPNHLVARLKNIYKKKFPIERRLIKAVNRIIDTDVRGIIFIGGGLIKFQFQFLSQPISYILQYSKKYGIPVMFSAVGIEGFDEQMQECKQLIHDINNSNVKVFTTRDDIKLLNHRIIYNKSILTGLVADPACEIAEYFVGGKKEKKRVGLNICRRRLFSDYGNKVDAKYLIDMWVELYILLEKKGYKPFLFTNGSSPDYQFAKKIAKELIKNGCDANIELIPNNVETLAFFISKCCGIIATRLHASIIAYSYNVPSIGFVWNKKQKMFGEIIGYPERFFAIDRYDIEEVVALFEKAMDEEYNTEKKKAYINSTKVYLNRFMDEFIYS